MGGRTCPSPFRAVSVAEQGGPPPGGVFPGRASCARQATPQAEAWRRSSQGGQRRRRSLLGARTTGVPGKCPHGEARSGARGPRAERSRFVAYDAPMNAATHRVGKPRTLQGCRSAARSGRTRGARAPCGKGWKGGAGAGYRDVSLRVFPRERLERASQALRYGRLADEGGRLGPW